MGQSYGRPGFFADTFKHSFFTSTLYVGGKALQSHFKLEPAFQDEQDVLKAGHPYYEAIAKLEEAGWDSYSVLMLVNALLEKYREKSPPVFARLLEALAAFQKPSLAHSLSPEAAAWLPLLSGYDRAKKSPRDEAAQWHYVSLCKKQGIPSLAGLAFDNLFALHPSDPTTVKKLDLLACHTIRNANDMVPVLKSFLSRVPHHTFLRRTLAVRLEETGSFREAARTYQQLLSVQPHNLQWHQKAVACYVRAHAYDQASRALAQAQRIFPHHPYFDFYKKRIAFEQAALMPLDFALRDDTRFKRTQIRQFLDLPEALRLKFGWSNADQERALMLLYQTYAVLGESAPDSVFEALLRCFEKQRKFPGLKSKAGVGLPRWLHDLHERVRKLHAVGGELEQKKYWSQRLLDFYRRCRRTATGLSMFLEG